ncbi:aminopeptidase N [Rhodobacteraceae bacterium]|nr:aminopeptidase N [Paracoccaceae bacterium]
MTDAAPQPIRLADYTAPNWLVEDVHLTFRLHPERTTVQSRIRFVPNPDTTERHFELMGEDLTLKSVRIDGQDCEYSVNDGLLTAKVPPRAFTWECEVEINPSANTLLEGLYMSNGIYCTQCEAEGFRKITFYPDRPDVMAPFTVRIEGDAPVLLSNGDPTGQGEGWAEWHDPWPKPSYLFALVAGDLVAHTGHQTTSEGREVTLNIWVQPGDEDRCAYALDALKRSMVWDEQVYGRAYDLDVFNLVAIDDFNAGAMENKGLNIFNSTYVLASPETATDDNYEWIESVVAHEYFHNWTGNRITCRDWFQLCLKEGLTVFRDQQFTSDMRSAPMKRIGDALKLRARQFREDNGPLAHSVRPKEYIEINNFYTATVYDKGAEVIGMLKTLVGNDAYAKALDLYFTRHDGQACTIEDWLKVFEDATGHDLTQFALWYSQAGTPRVDIKTKTTSDGWQVIASQSTPPTPGQAQKKPFVIPIRLAGYGQTGAEVLLENTVMLDQAQTVIAQGAGQAPIISAFRGFSAPVIVNQDLSTTDRLTLLAHDTDPFNRWEAGRILAKDQLMAMITDNTPPTPAFIDALGALLSDDTLDPAFRAFALGLPSPDDMAHTLFDDGQTPDPARIDSARNALQMTIAKGLNDTFANLFDEMETPGPFRPDAKDAGRRALRIGALAALTRANGPDRARTLYQSADNMTETLGALSALIRAGDASGELQSFYDRWKTDANVLDKWFAIQVSQASAEDALLAVETLTNHADFNWKTPNRFRSLIGAFAGNMAAFHHDSGRGYTIVADWLARLDPVNPRTAARMATVFETKRIFDGDRQSMMTDALNRLGQSPSRDMGEIVARILEA